MQALLDPSNLENAVKLVTKLDSEVQEISLKVTFERLEFFCFANSYFY